MLNSIKKVRKTNSGITLIALVITIIVLLILTGVAIATLTGDNGLLQKAAEAKQVNEEASALEKIKVEVAGSYGLDGKIDIENELNKNLLNIKELKFNGDEIDLSNPSKKIDSLPAIVELNGYEFVINNNGMVQEVIWKQDKARVTNIKTGKAYEVGDLVEYDCEIPEYTGQWGILGAENGCLLLMSTDNVANLTLSGKYDFLTDGTVKLNNVCKEYVNTKFSNYARCVKVEDINRVVDFNDIPNPMQNTFSYTMVNGKVKRNDKSASSETKFQDVYEKKLPEDSPIIVTANWYTYNLADKLTLGNKTYNFLNDNNNAYWLDSKVIQSYAKDAYWGFRTISNGKVWTVTQWGSINGASGSASILGVRVVISLKYNTKISENLNSNGLYDLN